MSEMVDRVAKAMADGDWEFIPEGESEYAEDGLFRGDYRSLARAAIGAMREPTEAVLNAGPPEPYMDRYVWVKMIDEALK